MDIATKFCVLKAIPDKTAYTIANEVVEIFCTFGPFRRLQSDNGTEFVNKAMETFKEHAGFEHSLISRYHSRADGAVERQIQTAVQVIRKRVNGAKADWDVYVKPTQLFINTKYIDRTKTPPFTLMFGRDANDFEDYGKLKEEPTRKAINQELQDRIKKISTIVLPAIHERTILVTQKMKERFDATHRIVEIPVGATVMVKVTGQKSKLDPNWVGPYTVKRVTSAGTYVLENEKGELESKNYPPSLIKMISNEAFGPNDQFYDVEAIIAHKKLDGVYHYKVKWKGYDDSENTWEPESNFADPKLITQYWQRIGVIPESITEINKANKKLLNRFVAEERSGKRKGTNTKRKNNKKSRSQ